MIDLAATAGQGVLSAFCMLLFASILSSSLYSVFRSFSHTLTTENQENATLLFVVIAPTSTMLAFVVLMHPDIASTIVFEHCHGASCTPHTPAPIIHSSIGAGLVALTTIASSLIIFLMSKTLRSAHRRQIHLKALSQPNETSHKKSSIQYRLIESDHLVAWCAGFLFPCVYVSTGLVQKLTKEQLNAVLAHEYQHVIRRDNLRKLVIQWSSAFWLPMLRQNLRKKYAYFLEQLADRRSANLNASAPLINEIYGMFQPAEQPEASPYQHRSVEKEKCINKSEGNLVSISIVYLYLALMLVIITLILTVTAHALLELL
jgi:Zn-dependent protease with chaperone function